MGVVLAFILTYECQTRRAKATRPETAETREPSSSMFAKLRLSKANSGDSIGGGRSLSPYAGVYGHKGLIIAL